MSSKLDVLPRISVRELYTHLISSSNAVLVLDCRARADYNASHPDSKKFPQWVSVPEETVRKGCVWSSLMFVDMTFLPFTVSIIWTPLAVTPMLGYQMHMLV